MTIEINLSFFFYQSASICYVITHRTTEIKLEMISESGWWKLKYGLVHIIIAQFVWLWCKGFVFIKTCTTFPIRWRECVHAIVIVIVMNYCFRWLNCLRLHFELLDLVRMNEYSIFRLLSNQMPWRKCRLWPSFVPLATKPLPSEQTEWEMLSKSSNTSLWFVTMEHQ